MNELISVIIPVYNVEEYIEKCLRSIINQTYNNLEIIVVNDGSTDNSGKIISEIAKEDERIIIIEQENCGVVTARNKGIETATGVYVAFVDADDWIESDMYEKMLAAIHEVDLVCTSYVVHTGDKEIIQYDYSKCGEYELNSMYGNLMRMGANVGVAPYLWNKLFRMDLVKKVYKKIDTSIRFGEDAVFVYLYLMHCKNVNIIDVKGYHYLCRENTASTKTDIAFLSNIDKMFQCLYRKFESNIHREELLRQLNKYILRAIRYQVRVQKIMARTFYYPYFGRLDNKKIVLYGAGSVGQSFYRDITEYEKDVVDVVLWADASYEKFLGGVLDFAISSPDKIKEVEYDYIIIAVFEPEIKDQIVCKLVDMGIDREKILWQRTKEF